MISNKNKPGSINFFQILSFVCGSLLLYPFCLQAKDRPWPPKKVFVMEIKAEIDPRTNRYVELALKEAAEVKAGLVIIELDTYGGAVVDADEIRTRLLELSVPVYVFINKDAASAGALISLACDSIYMAPGASIGAATVVTADGQAAPDKYQSYMRSIMRSTAEANGRNPKIAEAMVDERLEVDSVKKAGQVITFSTSEAIKYKFCEGEVRSIEEILKKTNVKNYELTHFKLSTTDRIVAFFLNPFVSGILILIIIGGIYYELQAPGIGFPLVAALIALALYFIPYYLNGLAENWEIIAFFIGVLLLAVEIFVIPGFGIFGVSGIVLMVGALILMMLNNQIFDFSFVEGGELTRAVVFALGGAVGGIILLFVAGSKFAQSTAFKNISLQEVQKRSEGYTANYRPTSMVGKKGTAYTVLRPSGKVMVDDVLYDAYTTGGYVEKGLEIIVVEDAGTSLKVKKIS